MTEKKFTPIKDKTSEIIDFIMNAPEMTDDEALRFKINLAVEEAVENIVSYAYSDGEGYLLVTMNKVDDVLTITLKDAGIPFDPLKKADPDLTLSAEKRNIGGLGIFLCKQMMDSVNYHFENGCNALTLIKKF